MSDTGLAQRATPLPITKAGSQDNLKEGVWQDSLIGYFRTVVRRHQGFQEHDFPRVGLSTFARRATGVEGCLAQRMGQIDSNT